MLTNTVYPLAKLHRPYCSLLTVFGQAPMLTSRATLLLLWAFMAQRGTALLFILPL